MIRKFLDKGYYSRPSWQYNALMLVRILTDNPGETFTRNFDAEFAETCRKLLKHGKDGRVRQMLMETLDDFEHTKMYDENLKVLIEMWKAQKEEVYKKHGVSKTVRASSGDGWADILGRRHLIHSDGRQETCYRSSPRPIRTHRTTLPATINPGVCLTPSN